MALKWIIPVAGLVALGSMALPAQSAPLGVGAETAQPSIVQQAHRRYHRHHRYHRYYRSPGLYFYFGPRHRQHRHWRHRHHRRWN